MLNSRGPWEAPLQRKQSTAQPRQFGFEPQFFHFLLVWHWACYLANSMVLKNFWNKDSQVLRKCYFPSPHLQTSPCLGLYPPESCPESRSPVSAGISKWRSPQPSPLSHEALQVLNTALPSESSKHLKLLWSQTPTTSISPISILPTVYKAVRKPSNKLSLSLNHSEIIQQEVNSVPIQSISTHFFPFKQRRIWRPKDGMNLVPTYITHWGHFTVRE